MIGAIHCARSSASATCGRIGVLRRRPSAPRPRPRPSRRAGAGARLAATIVAREVSVEPVRVDDVRVRRIDRVMRSFAARRVDPLDGRDPVAALRSDRPCRAGCRCPGSIRRPRPACSCRASRCRTATPPADDGELPGLAGVRRRVEAAVVRVVEHRRVRRIDPEPVMIAVHAAQRRERLAGVVRDVEAEAERVDGVLVRRDRRESVRTPSRRCRSAAS